jgi:hypothetical protein
MNFNLGIALICGVLAALAVDPVTSTTLWANAGLITVAVWNAWLAGNA